MKFEMIVVIGFLKVEMRKLRCGRGCGQEGSWMRRSYLLQSPLPHQVRLRRRSEEPIGRQQKTLLLENSSFTLRGMMWIDGWFYVD